MSTDLCEMKVVELRNLAKKKNIDIRDENQKLKNKCRLIIDIIKTPEMSRQDEDEVDFSEVEFERPKKQKKNKKSAPKKNDEDEIDFGEVEFERSKPKKVSFDSKNDTKIVKTEYDSGKGIRRKSNTRRPITEEQIKTFIPRKARQKERQRLETQFMGQEDVRI